MSASKFKMKKPKLSNYLDTPRKVRSGPNNAITMEMVLFMRNRKNH